ncbi:MAG: tetratricopeptide repeat protein [Geitlerinemataceae cyanobacterium]
MDFARTQLGLPEPPETLETVPQQVEWVCRRWRGEPVLVVLDDVVDYKSVKPYVQKLDSRFRVLMTTRLQLGTAARRLELDVLTEAAALELLRVLVEDAERIDSQLEDAKKLCQWLGYLPLGLELVGRYLARKRDVSLAQMLERLQGKRLAAKALVKTEEDMTAQLGVAAAFELSWEELPEEARVLCGLLSIFALAPISWEWVETCLSDWEEEELEDCRDEELVGRSLLARVGERRYELHQLIREFFAAKLGTELQEVAEASQRGVARVMVAQAQQVPQTVTLTDLAKVEEALPHLEVVAQSLTPLLAESTDAMWVFTGLARVAAAQSRWGNAEDWYEACREMTEHRFGADHPDTASSLNNLAGLYESMGRYTEAEPLYVRSLSIWEQQLGGDHPSTATSLNNLAELYYAMGRYSEAEPLYVRSLSIRERQLGGDHPSTATSLNNLALLYESMGRYTEAEPLYVRTLAILTQCLPENHPHIQAAIGNFCYLIQQAVENGKAGELSAHPLTQEILSNK